MDEAERLGSSSSLFVGYRFLSLLKLQHKERNTNQPQSNNEENYRKKATNLFVKFCEEYTHKKSNQSKKHNCKMQKFFQNSHRNRKIKCHKSTKSTILQETERLI